GLREWLQTVPRRAAIDGDPGFTQVRNLRDPSFRRCYEAYTAFFSVGANMGKPSCAIPMDGFQWETTRPPVSLVAWPYVQGRCHGRYTTVMQWETFPGVMQHRGLILANKSESFRPYCELPRRLGPSCTKIPASRIGCRAAKERSRFDHLKKWSTPFLKSMLITMFTVGPLASWRPSIFPWNASCRR